jgi:hypothetical protein
LTVFGEVTLKKDHLLQHNSFKITMYVQSLICFLSQSLVFEEASKLLNRTLNVNVSAKQCQRVSEWYGAQLDPIINANHIEYIPQLSPLKSKDEHTYIMIDGSMIYTRDDGWKENKLARIFKESKNVEVQQGRKEVVENVYVSHLGSVDIFLPKLERHISLVKGRKVFIADGARWIWNFVEDNYPGAVQILDYYHAVEKLEALIKNHYKNSTKGVEWYEKQKELLLEDRVDIVIDNIKALKPQKESTKEMKHAVLNYYVENEDRMLYKTYRNKGLLIGSGPIEAANRSVIQQRMKLSGQKWSIKGANAIANLRCYDKSNAWPIIEELIKLAA